VSARVRFTSPEEWERVRDLRLRALVDAPDAFSATLESERDATESGWRAMVTGWEGATNAMAIAELDGDWVGMAVGMRKDDASEAHLFAMWVDPARRRAGVGAELVRAVLAWARSSGATSVVLGVTDTNDGAVAFYEHLGFVDTGERHPLREGSELVVRGLRLPL
jgi:ribosomal protein S18 acetylase RimI-like enzyme